MFTIKTKNKYFFVQFLSLVIIISITLPLFFKYISLQNQDMYASAENTEKSIIVIDAGHGGEDCGAIGANNIYEKDLNMAISMKLGDYLRAAGYDVIYTRTEDCLLYTEEQNIKGMRKIYDLKNRVEIANSFSNALFISIHMNSFGSTDCSGLQVYYSTQIENAKTAATKIQESVISRLQPQNRRSIKKGDDIYILENATVPAILIECGFISNPEECKKLSEKEYQKELSFAILCGIIEYDKNNRS